MRVIRQVTAAFVVLMAASPALAQVCKEEGVAPRGEANLTCDMSYRNSIVTCDPKTSGAVVGTLPPCPPKPMPMLDTPLKSYISDYSPYLFTFPRDALDFTRPYSGTYSVGTQGNNSDVMQMFGKPVSGVRPMAACKTLLNVPGYSATSDVQTQARVNRLQMDNCTNEYILSWAISPFQDEIPMTLAGDDPSDPAKLVDLQSQCQPINSNISSDDEYLPSDYLKAAWTKLLIDPNYRKSTPGSLKFKPCISPMVPCDREPHLPQGVSLSFMTSNGQPVPLPDPFPEVRISQLGAVQYEKINDPTHPFSPRWDYKLNDRQYSDPLKAGAMWAEVPKVAANYALMRTYMMFPENAVFCAGVKSQNKLQKLMNAYNKISQFDTSNLSVPDLSKAFSDVVAKGTGAFDKFGLDKLGMDKFNDVLKDGKLMSALEDAANGKIDALKNLPQQSLEKIKDLQSKVNLGGFDNIDLSKLTDSEKLIAQAGQKFSTIKDVNFAQLQAISQEKITGALDKAKALNISDVQLGQVNDILAGIKEKGLDPELFGKMGDAFKDLGSVVTDAKQIPGISDAINNISDISAGNAAKFSDFKDGFGALKSAVGGKVEDVSSVSDFYNQAKLVAQDPATVGSAKDMFAAAKSAGMSASDTVNAIKTIADKGITLQGGDAISNNAKTLINAMKKNGSLDKSILDSAALVKTLESSGKTAADLTTQFGKLESAVKGGLPISKIDSLMGDLTTLQKQGSDLLNVDNALSAYNGMLQKGYTPDQVQYALKTIGVPNIGLPQIAVAKDLTSKLNVNGVTSTVLASAQQQLKGGSIFRAASSENDSEVPVDVLEFRREPFEEALFRRTKYNAACYLHKDFLGGAEAPLATVFPQSFCYQITRIVPFPPFIYARGLDCWKCFGLSGMLKSDEEPPCTTNYLGEDKKMKLSGLMFPGPLNLLSAQAQCNYPLQKRDSKYNMDKVCADLRKPFTPMNRLKMRYYNPDDTAGNAMTEGVGEGLTFKEYFGNHMPYPRLWDTGSSLQKKPATETSSQPPLDTTGKYTAIVGVGREGSPKAASDGAPAVNGKKPADLYTDQRCKTMGWGSPSDLSKGLLQAAESAAGLDPNYTVSVAGTKVSVPDPLTSWAELKLYQARSARSEHMNCLARYEKAFKPESTESMVLNAAGADWAYIVVSKCERKQAGQTENCTDMSLKDYVAAGSPKNDSSYVYLTQTKNSPVPNAWRGYLASTIENGKYKFPDFGDTSGGGGGMLAGLFSGKAKISGLSNAKVGDIILMPYGPKDDQKNPGLAKLALVIETGCPEKEKCYVRVLEPDNGKFPDVCGTTDMSGMMKSRYYFKPGALPKAAKAFYDKMKFPTSNCEESRLSQCEMSAWDKLTLYRIYNDRRKPCNKKSANDC